MDSRSLGKTNSLEDTTNAETEAMVSVQNDLAKLGRILSASHLPSSTGFLGKEQPTIRDDFGNNSSVL